MIKFTIIAYIYLISQVAFNLHIKLFNMFLYFAVWNFLFHNMLHCCSRKSVCFVFEHTMAQFTAYPVVHPNPLYNIGVLPVMWVVPILAYIMKSKI